MRSDKAPKLERHAGLPSRRADHANKHTVGHHHPDGANPRGDPHGKRGEGYGKVVGHNAGSSEGLDRHDGLCPHFFFLDGFHHLWPQQAVREAGIVDRHGPSCDPRHSEYEKG